MKFWVVVHVVQFGLEVCKNLNFNVINANSCLFSSPWT